MLSYGVCVDNRRSGAPSRVENHLLPPAPPSESPPLPHAVAVLKLLHRSSNPRHQKTTTARQDASASSTSGVVAQEAQLGSEAALQDAQKRDSRVVGAHEPRKVRLVRGTWRLGDATSDADGEAALAVVFRSKWRSYKTTRTLWVTQPRAL